MIISIVKANVLRHEFAPDEEGCEQYESYIDGETFIAIEHWRDQEALDKLLNTGHIANYLPRLKECIVGGQF